MLTQELPQIGQKVWIQYYLGEYLGEENGKHKVKYKKGADTVETIVNYIPLIDDDWVPPLYLKEGKDYLKYNNRKTCWNISGQLEIYYEFKSTSTFKQIEHYPKTKIESFEVVQEYVFLSEEDIYDQIYEIDNEIQPLEKQINDLRTQINQISKKKENVYSRCFHEWEYGEEEQTSSNALGTGFKKECTCNKCGKTQTSYYTRL